MPIPVAIATSYLAVNVALMLWSERELRHGRIPRGWAMAMLRTLRYGPPLLGFLYLVTIAEDWPFFLFVVAFFLVAVALLNGLLHDPSRRPRR